MRKLFGLFLLSSALVGLSQPVVPISSTTTNWTNAGLTDIGGIPFRTSINQTFSPGISAATLNTALANAPSNSVIFLNAGTYNLGGTVFMPADGVTLRGAGPTATILLNSTVEICPSSRTGPPYAGFGLNPIPWIAGYAQYNTVVTLSSTSGLQVGNILGFYQNDSGITVGGNPCGTCEPDQTGNANLQQYVKVVAINGNQVTITPGLYSSLWSGNLSPQAYFWPLNQTTKMSGVEDLQINGTSDSECLLFACDDHCWARNVWCTNGFQFSISWWGGIHSEVRHCRLDRLTLGNAANNYGWSLRWVSDGLVTDNILTTFPNDRMEGVSGFVFSYNFGTNWIYDNPPSWLGETLMHHGGFPNYNLFEGNYWGNFVADNIKGAGGYATWFRSRLNGWEPGKTGGTYAVAIMPDEWYINIVGCILGTPGIQTVYQDNGQGGEILANTANNQNAVNSWVFHGNYDTVNASITWGTNSNHVLPNSYYLSSAPTNFGILKWPPYDPTAIANNSAVTPALATNIPAGYRYWLGVDPPPFGCTNPVIAANPTSLNFNSILTNTSKNLTFWVTNVCGGTLVGTASANAPFSVTAGGSYSLASNVAQQVTVTYNPTVPSGLDSGILTCTGGGGASVNLTGYAYALLGMTFYATNGLLSNNVYSVSNQFIFDTNAASDPVSGAQAYFYVNVPSNNTYFITASNAIAPNSSQNSYYFVWNTNASEPYNVWDMNPPVGVQTNYNVAWRGFGTASNDQFQPNLWPLTQGTNVLIVSSREDHAYLGQMTINAFVPPPPSCTNPVIAISPPSAMNFGSILTNTTKNLTFTVSNSCGGTLIGTATTSSPYSIVSGGSYSLITNQIQVVTVKYAPTVVSASDLGTVTCTGGGGATVSLTGSAFANINGRTPAYGLMPAGVF